MRAAAAGGSEDGDAVVAAACAGDPDAWASIWRQHAPAVHGYLRAHGATNPEDLTSEVFVAVFGRIRRFRGGENELRAFIFTVAHHRLIDDRRRRANQPPSTSYDPDIDSRQTPSAEQAGLAQLGAERARNLIEALPREQRDVMLLRVIGDLTLEQTAAVLGKRVGAVKAAQHRALIRLRQLLAVGVSL